MADTTGEQDLRAENFSRIVKGFALQEYKMKQLCMIESSSAWTETYYKETAADLTGGTGSNVKGVPRLANFPYGEVSWTKTSGRNVKHGMEGILSWEDVKTNNVPMIARTLLKIVYLSYEQTVKSEQLYIEEQVLGQLNIEINLTFPATLQNELISSREKDSDLAASQPNDTTAELEGER